VRNICATQNDSKNVFFSCTKISHPKESHTMEKNNENEMMMIIIEFFYPRGNKISMEWSKKDSNCMLRNKKNFFCEKKDQKGFFKRIE